MRFPLRVVAITGVEAGSGKDRGACYGVFFWCGLLSLHLGLRLVSAVISVWRMIKESRGRELVGLLKTRPTRSGCMIATVSILWGIWIWNTGSINT
jgi:hypothetical protein